MLIGSSPGIHSRMAKTTLKQLLRRFKIIRRNNHNNWRGGDTRRRAMRHPKASAIYINSAVLSLINRLRNCKKCREAGATHVINAVREVWRIRPINVFKSAPDLGEIYDPQKKSQLIHK